MIKQFSSLLFFITSATHGMLFQSSDFNPINCVSSYHIGYVTYICKNIDAIHTNILKNELDHTGQSIIASYIKNAYTLSMVDATSYMKLGPLLYKMIITLPQYYEQNLDKLIDIYDGKNIFPCSSHHYSENDKKLGSSLFYLNIQRMIYLLCDDRPEHLSSEFADLHNSGENYHILKKFFTRLHNMNGNKLLLTLLPTNLQNSFASAIFFTWQQQFFNENNIVYNREINTLQNTIRIGKLISTFHLGIILGHEIYNLRTFKSATMPIIFSYLYKKYTSIDSLLIFFSFPIEMTLCYMRKKQLEHNRTEALKSRDTQPAYDKVFLKIQPDLSPVRQDAATAGNELYPYYTSYSRYFVPTVTLILKKIFNIVQDSEPFENRDTYI